ncbi:Putative 2-nitropropane dioxygenase [[Torrubiella] hemipterigena]|uniref:Putative 2-nitropropane dioxygenase n=1 Tax=[Torrubiella] hemipterigena TaxID=1531966 RepID=A0A0A1TKB4_9HYPO|nr:Putative 2-nitropropane dioxygenase [[Torrubiella] hemipterigena]
MVRFPSPLLVLPFSTLLLAPPDFVFLPRVFSFFRVHSNHSTAHTNPTFTMPLATELTRRLGIRVPVVQGGMMHIGTADLAAAVSNAGGLGIITALIFTTPAALRDEIRRCRTLTKKPFAVNMTLLPSMVPPDYPAYAQTIIDEGIKIVETAGNSPGPIITQLKKAGIIVLHKCTTIRHALSAVKLGVDFLSIDGFECAGHVGESDITNFILLSRARQTLKIPFIASGGFADGQGLAAALSLGACGINMGTRFMCTVEAPIHQNIKEQIVKSDENDTTLLLRRWKNTTRLFKNKVTRDALKVEKESTTGEFSEVAPLVSGKRGKEVFINGDPEFGVWTTGQVMGLIHDIPTCAVLVRRIETEAETSIKERLNLIIPESKL